MRACAQRGRLGQQQQFVRLLVLLLLLLLLLVLLLLVLVTRACAGEDWGRERFGQGGESKEAE